MVRMSRRHIGWFDKSSVSVRGGGGGTVISGAGFGWCLKLPNIRLRVEFWRESTDSGGGDGFLTCCSDDHTLADELVEAADETLDELVVTAAAAVVAEMTGASSPQ